MKTIFLFCFVNLSLNAFSQSLNLHDLKFLLSNPKYNKFLTGKSFKLESGSSLTKKNIKAYFRNEGEKKESVSILPSKMTGQVLLQGPISLEPIVIYSTLDTSYFNNFLKDIRESGIKLFNESKREDKTFKQYSSRYKDNRFIIDVTRTEYKNRRKGFISVMWSH